MKSDRESVNLVKCTLRAAMARRGVTYDHVAERLAELHVKDSGFSMMTKPASVSECAGGSSVLQHGPDPPGLARHAPSQPVGVIAQVAHLLEHGGAGNVLDTFHDDAPGLVTGVDHHGHQSMHQTSRREGRA